MGGNKELGKEYQRSSHKCLCIGIIIRLLLFLLVIVLLGIGIVITSSRAAASVEPGVRRAHQADGPGAYALRRGLTKSLRAAAARVMATNERAKIRR